MSAGTHPGSGPSSRVAAIPLRAGQGERARPGRSVAPEPAGRWIPAALLFTGLALGLAFTHQDDMDAAIYSILARNVAADGFSLHLRATPPGSLFFEHPPLWLWTLGLLARLLPGVRLGLASIPCGVVTLWLSDVLGRRLVGARAAQWGLVLLAVDLPFVLQHALPRLDAPLTLAFTSSVALLVLAEGRAPWLLAGGLAAGLGTLVKGPPSLGAPLAAALVAIAAGRGGDLRRPRTWLWVGLGVSLPPLLFLGYDALVLRGEWARHYLDGQVLASLDGRRTAQFGRGPLYLLTAGIWARARHLAPLAVVALAPLLRGGDPRRGPRLALLLWIAVLVAGFGIASRAYWFYLLPAFPPLALLAGAGLDDLAGLLRASTRERIGRVVPGVASIAGAILLLAGPMGALRWAGDACPYGDLPTRAAAAASEGRMVGVVTDASDWATQPLVADHGRCEVERFLEVEGAIARPDVAAVIAPRRLAVPDGWRESGATAGWALWTRTGRGTHAPR